MTPTEEIVLRLIDQHRFRRYAMKIQQKLDRALESFVRINWTDWRPDESEEERDKFKTIVNKKIADARNGIGDDGLIQMVLATDESRAPADRIKKERELKMEELVRGLPVYPWADAVDGIGDLGLANIIAEAGHPLTDFATVSKLWKRLGFAPYDGHAGSSWKRSGGKKPWVPRSLTKEEWIANPFSGARYAVIHQSAVWLRNNAKQRTSVKKSGEGFGLPVGPYGHAYVARRQHTAATHPDWTNGHADKDAIRFMMKRFLRDLWIAWHEAEGVPIKRSGNQTRQR